MTTPYVPGLDGPEKGIDPQDLIELLRANLDAKTIQLIEAKAKASDLTAALDRRLPYTDKIPEDWLDKERAEHKQRVAWLRADVENNDRRLLKMDDMLTASILRVDTLAIKLNDHMFNVCRLTSAALSHLWHIPPYVKADTRVVLMARQMQIAIDLLKPLSTGIHDTHPWQEGGLTNFADDGMTVLNNDKYDPSMGQDPWNEFGAHDIPKDLTPDVYMTANERVGRMAEASEMHDDFMNDGKEIDLND